MIFRYFLFLVFIASIGGLSSCKSDSPEANAIPAKSDTLSTKPADGGFSVAFIYGDSINNSYQFLVDAKKELESEETNMQARLKAKLQRAEQRAMELQQKAASMTQMQMQEAQLELQGLDIEMQQFQEKLAGDFRKREVELQKDYIGRVDSFLTRYNADGRFDMILNYQQGGQVLYINTALDITPEVLAGLNAEYTSELKAKAETPKK